MKKRFSSVSLLLSFVVTVAGQTPPAPAPPQGGQESAPARPAQPPRDASTQKGAGVPDDVVRISVNLVQIDVTVTDDKGRQVTDLRPEDFEVFEEGRPQQVTNFSYVTPAARKGATATAPASLPLAATPAAGAGKPAGKTLLVPTPVPPARLRPDQVRRTVALVVDDLGLSHDSSVRVREALRKFVDEQIQPGDLAAIIRTGAGMGALQQFTTDKRQLHAAIDRVRYNLGSRSQISTFAPIGGETLIRDPTGQPLSHDIQKDPFFTGVKQPGRELDEFREDLFSVGTLGALNFVVRGLKDLPGRKSVVLFSDGFRMYTQDPGNDRVRENLQRLTDLANRASVVFYSIDPRGLQTFGITAADNLSGPISSVASDDVINSGDISYREYMQEVERRVADRRKDFYESQHGLSYLATQTGGFLVKNNNDIGGAISRVLDDQSGFYLLGYRPDDAASREDGTRFRNISVRVRRPGLRVRTRKGFYNFTDEERRRPVYRNASEQMFAALTSPFNAGDIALRMTALFGYDQQRGPFTQSMLHINAQDLRFRQAPDGSRETTIDIMAVTFGDNGKVVDQDARAYKIGISEQDFQRATRAGLVYIVTLPVKKPGAYQLRVAVRDQATSRVGSANQYIDVPDVKKGRLALSGVTLRGLPPVAMAGGARPAAEGGSAPVVAASQSQGGGVDLNDPQTGPAGRRLRRGMVLHYGYYVYNAQLDKAARRPQLNTQTRLFRDGQLVYAGKVSDFSPAPQGDGKQLIAGGSLQLGGDLAPGEYVLQVVVLDRLAKGDRQLASQWIDFEIVR